ncbi:alcohol dehydrogenase [Bacillus manliponensis]|uniref:Alcohol dehydrogenase n=1 Tax=Bacillus manliponensis TaxID=574376 RepID=A0A073KCB2_9BACI|nr:iron-containing alcohol dehydrogenase [Bacillus manliponensis]KEK19908.1 alcohol dehydrogenase [Bacillus manliponensis]
MATTYSPYMMRTVVHSGSGSRVMIPDLFRGLGGKRVILFSDRGLQQAGVVDQVAEIFSLTTHGVGPELAGIYLDISPDPDMECVNDAIRYAREKGADGLLAVGGGSVQDVVKAVKYALHKGISDIEEAIPTGVVIMNWPEANYIPIPHIAVPTTAGTGAEVSPGTVISNKKLNVKSGMLNPFITADMAVLDPDLTVGLPPMMTAATGFDALTHAIEALVSPNATAFTDSYAIHAIRLIDENLPLVVENGKNIEARMLMLQASTMAIMAFIYAPLIWPVHNFAHAYGTLYNIPHGVANGVLLPVVMERLPGLYEANAHKLADALRIDTNGNEPPQLLKGIVNKIKALQEKVGLQNNFTQYNARESDLEQVIQAVATDPLSVAYPIPVEIITAVGKQVIETVVQAPHRY